jgi:hypothetical protein
METIARHAAAADETVDGATGPLRRWALAPSDKKRWNAGTAV